MSAGRDTDWFMEQVRREQSRLRAFVRALGVRAEAVDDIAQDALLIAYERLDVFRGDEGFGAWVRGIARRLVANWLRKENRRRVILSEHMTELLAVSAPEQLHPLAETGQGERLAALKSCLEQLPARGQQLVHL